MELDEILYRLQRLAEPNGLITSDIEWAKAQLIAWRDKQVGAARIDELERLLNSGERYGWGETFATDHMGIVKRIAELSKDRSEDG